MDEDALMPYAIVSSVRLSFSMSLRMRAMGIVDPAAIPVLTCTLMTTTHDGCSIAIP